MNSNLVQNGSFYHPNAHVCIVPICKLYLCVNERAPQKNYGRYLRVLVSCLQIFTCTSTDKDITIKKWITLCYDPYLCAGVFNFLLVISPELRAFGLALHLEAARKKGCWFPCTALSSVQSLLIPYFHCLLDLKPYIMTSMNWCP